MTIAARVALSTARNLLVIADISGDAFMLPSGVGQHMGGVKVTWLSG